MKKTLSVISLILCFLFVFSACGNISSGDEEEPATELIEETQTEENKQEESETQEIETELSLPDVKRFEPSKYIKRNFAIKDDRVGISLFVPQEWEITATSTREYSVKRNGTVVGKMTSRPQDSKDWEIYESHEASVNGIGVSRILEHKKGNFRYRYTYTYSSGNTERSFTLTCDYSEISDFAMNKLSLPQKDPFTTASNFTPLPSDRTYRSVLIIGNSFIRTSAVGDMLDNMIKNGKKGCRVTAISTSYALVSTYTSDKALMNEILGGNYDAVFMCGLYNDAQLDEVLKLKICCQKSNTELVIFPAHNEERSVINKVVSTYDDLILLDWKGDIDALINMGVDRWDMCVDDAHDHSLPTAGYVGAHMIYRAMYGEIPPVISGNVAGYTQQNMNALFGDYVKTGAVELAERSDVYFFMS